MSRHMRILSLTFVVILMTTLSSAEEVEHVPDVSLKLTTFGSLSDDSNEPDSNSTLLYTRATLKSYWNDNLRSEFAGSVVALHNDSSQAGITDAVPTAFRISSLEWPTWEDDYQSLITEIDRASVTFDFDHGEKTSQLVIGRQAIGLGSRGVLFTAVDFFAPFSPFDVDREWKRGVDAIWYDTMLSESTSMSLACAFGPTIEEGVYIARVRGASFESNLDGEIIIGTRGEDELLAVTGSTPLGEAELHAEFAMFRVNEADPTTALFGDEHLLAKAVIGTSYNFPIGENGLKIFLDYHYNGFGGEDITDIYLRQLDPAFQARMARGDFQTLGRHALAFQAQYDLSDESSLGINIVGNPQDASGIVTASLSYSATDDISLLFACYAAYGDEANGIFPMSEYGDSPTTVMLQARIQF